MSSQPWGSVTDPPLGAAPGALRGQKGPSGQVSAEAAQILVARLKQLAGITTAESKVKIRTSPSQKKLKSKKAGVGLEEG